MMYLTELMRSIARDVAREVVAQEMPKVLDNLSKPGKMLSDIVDYNTAAGLLHISKPTLHTYIKTGKLTKVTLVDNGKPFLRRSEIEAMMKKSRKVNPSLN